MTVESGGPAKQLAAARAEAKVAEAANAEASSKLLASLKRQSVEKRFAAFESAGKTLTAEDRRELLKSIKDSEPATRSTVSANTASRFAIWQSGLRYRVVTLASMALMGTLVVIGLAVASARTPDYAVASVYTYPVATEFRSPSGTIYANTMQPGQRYVAIGQSAGQTRLRLWVPRQGYAIASVPSEWLRRVR